MANKIQLMQELIHRTFVCVVWSVNGLLNVSKKICFFCGKFCPVLRPISGSMAT
uniref:Putative LOC101238983 [Hydra vulgaris] n=1 Tax=Lepeophtheirus salmonis TaxID=72036 RepID=A0A0K2ULK0_LEPSM